MTLSKFEISPAKHVFQYTPDELKNCDLKTQNMLKQKALQSYQYACDMVDEERSQTNQQRRDVETLTIEKEQILSREREYQITIERLQNQIYQTGNKKKGLIYMLRKKLTWWKTTREPSLTLNCKDFLSSTKTSGNGIHQNSMLISLDNIGETVIHSISQLELRANGPQNIGKKNKGSDSDIPRPGGIVDPESAPVTELNQDAYQDK